MITVPVLCVKDISNRLPCSFFFIRSKKGFPTSNMTTRKEQYRRQPQTRTPFMLGMSGIVIKEMKCLTAHDICYLWVHQKCFSHTHPVLLLLHKLRGLYRSNPQPFALGILVKIERERESISDKTEHFKFSFCFSTFSGKCQIKV